MSTNTTSRREKRAYHVTIVVIIIIIKCCTTLLFRRRCSSVVITLFNPLINFKPRRCCSQELSFCCSFAPPFLGSEISLSLSSASLSIYSIV